MVFIKIVDEGEFTEVGPGRPNAQATLTLAVTAYRRIREMLVAEGWRVNVKRVYRIWRREGLKVPMKQPKRGRVWLNDGSCVRLRPEQPNHVVVL